RGAPERDGAAAEGGERHLRTRGAGEKKSRRADGEGGIPGKLWGRRHLRPSVRSSGALTLKNQECYVPAPFGRRRIAGPRIQTYVLQVRNEVLRPQEDARPLPEVRHGPEGRAPATDLAGRPPRCAPRQARRVRRPGCLRPQPRGRRRRDRGARG